LSRVVGESQKNTAWHYIHFPLDSPKLTMGKGKSSHYIHFLLRTIYQKKASSSKTFYTPRQKFLQTSPTKNRFDRLPQFDLQFQFRRLSCSGLDSS
jgi:hypothetical protein